MQEIELKKLQIIELDIFKNFHELCKKYNLKYSLAYGTCIGAVRHQGFIPWDDDIDVAMPRKDYEKFIEIAKDRLNHKYFFQNYSTDKKCGLIFGKIRKNDTIMSEYYSYHIDMHQGIWIDIFPYDNIPDDENDRKKMFRKIKVYKNLYIIKSGYKIPENRNNFLNKIMFYLAKICLFFIPINFLIERIDKILKQYNNKPCKYMFPFGGNTIKNIMPCELMDNFIEVDFEDTKANIFKDYDYYLSQIYGDYMKIPSEEERKTWTFHFIKEFKG